MNIVFLLSSAFIFVGCLLIGISHWIDKTWLGVIGTCCFVASIVTEFLGLVVDSFL